MNYKTVSIQAKGEGACSYSVPAPVVKRIQEADRTQAVLNEVNNWLVCHPITSPDDMAQSFEYMQSLVEKALRSPSEDEPKITIPKHSR